MRGVSKLLALVFLSAGSALSASTDDVLVETPPRQGSRIPVDFASLDISTRVNLADLVFFEGLKFSAQYRYQVEPSYQGGYFTRIDRYKLNLGISPGDFFKVEDLPVFMKIDRGSEIIFVRQFESQLKAVVSPPVFDPRRIPFNSKLAIEHMHPGDFVAIPTEMNIVIGANASYPIVPGLDANLGISAGILTGKFQLHIFRMPDNKIRLRLISDRANDVTATAGIRSSYEFFGINIADSVVSRFVRADLPGFSVSKVWGSMVLLDYIYDLNKEEVRGAYDRILRSTFRFRFRDLTVTEGLRDKLLSDLLETERIRLADLNLPVDQQRIRRLFSGDNDYRNRSTRLRLGTSFMNFTAGAVKAENRVTYFDRQDRTRRYDYLTAVSNSEAGLGWGLLKYQKNIGLSALVSNPDHGGALSELENVNLSFEVKDKYISHKQSDGLISSLEYATGGRIFPESLFDPWKNAEKIRDGRFLLDLWISKYALRQIEGMSAEELLKKFTRYIDDQNLDQIYVQVDRGARGTRAEAFSKFYRFQIRQAAEKLAKVLDPSLMAADRARAFTSLKGNMPFERLGTGFIISQLGGENLDRAILSRVRAYASGIDQIVSIYGRSENLELLNSLQYMQYVLGDGYFDPRWDPIPDLSGRDP